MWLNGSYVAPLRRIDGGIRARTHLAQVRFGVQLETAYVKAFEAGADHMLFNEVAGGMLARRAAIGSPPGGLLWVPLAALEHLFPGVRFARHEGRVPCYACAPVQTGYGLAAVGVADALGQVADLVRKTLLAWAGFGACVAFDEWVANPDRHPNNLLFAAGGKLVPIDHSDCFGGPERRDDFTGPHAWYRNRLLEDLFQPDSLPLPIKAALVHAAERLPECAAHCTEDLARLQPWLGNSLGLNWAEWVVKRASLTAEMMRERVRMLV